MKKSKIILIALAIFWSAFIFIMFLSFRINSDNNKHEKACFKAEKNASEIKYIKINTSNTFGFITIHRKQNANIIEVPEMKKFADEYLKYYIINDTLIINLKSNPGIFKGKIDIYLPKFEYVKANRCGISFVDWSKTDTCKKLNLDFNEVYNNYNSPSDMVYAKDLNLNMKCCYYKIVCNNIIKNADISLYGTNLNLEMKTGILKGKMTFNSNLNISKSDSLQNEVIKDKTSTININ